jgi:hypothetical protein
MRPARVHVGQIIAVAAIVVSAIWSASQSAAAPLGRHPALGPAWLAVISFPVFLPWRLFGWGYAYETPSLLAPSAPSCTRRFLRFQRHQTAVECTLAQPLQR